MGQAHHWKAKVTKRSDCFRWLKELRSMGLTKFRFGCLPESLKNLSMLHRATASGLLKEVEKDNNGRKTWELNAYEISRIEEQ